MSALRALIANRRARRELARVQAEHVEALRALKRALDEQNKFARAVRDTSVETAERVFADMITDQVGSRVGGAARTTLTFRIGARMNRMKRLVEALETERAALMRDISRLGDDDADRAAA